MKFSQQWLEEWVQTDITSAELVAQLNLAGLEVDDITPVAGDFTGVHVGKIIDSEPHPNADKLRLCTVSDGTQEYQVICGAPNARTGIKVAYAMVGAILPGKIKIKAAKLRQITSQGMLCSAAELGLGDDHDGIMELDEHAPLGLSFRQYMDLEDQIIDIDLTPNRGDCLCMAGIAREIGVLNKVPLNWPQTSELAPQIDDTFTIKVADPDTCPRFTTRIIRNLNIKAPTPLWMIEKLRRSGIRSIDAAVDITAYVMLELGQPMHAYDLDKLNRFIHVRQANQDETLTLLNDQQVKLAANTLVIADSEGAIGLAGIMGGKETAVNANTCNILLESAYFNPLFIAGRARSYGLHTDASHRFERGVDYTIQRQAIDRATQLLIDICGGQAGPIIEEVTTQNLPKQPSITLRKKRLCRILGQDFSDMLIEDILTRLGLELMTKEDIADLGTVWTYQAPSWRFDLTIEADLIEEIARIYGYNNLPTHLPEGALKIAPAPEKNKPLSTIKQHMVSLGYHESITYSMVDETLQAQCDNQHTPISLANPISSDMTVMRTSIWPGLIKALVYNQHRQQARVRLFEVGQCFIPHTQELKQIDYIAGIVTGSRIPISWNNKGEAVDFFDLKNDVNSLVALTGKHQAFTYQASSHTALHPGQCADLMLCNHPDTSPVKVGTLGTMHPSLAKAHGIQGEVIMFEIQLDALTDGRVPIFQPLSKYPEVRRDIAILIAEEYTAAQVQQLISDKGGEQLKQINVFDVYQGKGIAEKHKSLALNLTWQHPERTLTDDEINHWLDNIITTLTAKLGAQLRE